MKHVSAIILLILVTAGQACDSLSSESYREMIVVESYLSAGDPLPKVRVTTTMPAGELYEFEDAAVAGATVNIRMLPKNPQSPPDEFPYEMQEPGIYTSLDSTHRVQPRRTYLLEITDITNHDTVRATTTVPDTFHVMNTVPESLTYQSGPLELRISANHNPGRQNIYIFATIAEDNVPSNLTPFYQALVENDLRTLPSLTKNASTRINTGITEPNPDGSIDLKYPWNNVAFFGRNRIITNSIDLNISDFLRSQDVQLGGSALSPGEIPNVIYHMEGGIGVFGSIATDTVRVEIIRP